MKLNDKQVEALDLLLSYVIEYEESDYCERVEDGDSVEDHVYVLAQTLVEAFDSAQKRSSVPRYR